MQKGEIAQAEKLCRKICRTKPANASAWEALANVQVATGNYEAVVKNYRRVVELQPDNFMAFYNLAIACSRLDLIDDAITALRKAIQVNPQFSLAIVMLSEIYRGMKSYSEAIELLRSSVTHNTEDVRINWLLGACLQDTDELEQATRYFNKACHLMRSCNQQPNDFYPTHDPELGDTFKSTAAYKLQHDIEQFEYLMGKGLLDTEYSEVVANYKKLLAVLRNENSPVNIMQLSKEGTAMIGGTYNRLVYESTRGRDCTAPLNPDIDWNAVVSDYQCNQPGITYIDELLRPDVLQELYEYCLESTVWFDYRHKGYVGAYADDGFDNPLLFRIAEELRTAMPELLSDHPIRYIWAYQYDQQLEGIGIHGDDAAVNVNFWVTPDSANLNTDTGGLVVHRAEAPSHWNFKKYNNNTEEIHRFLKKENAGSMRVPYRRNRAVIFNSDLFHETDNPQFREGFENRRINITMLFGHRTDKH